MKVQVEEEEPIVEEESQESDLEDQETDENTVETPEVPEEDPDEEDRVVTFGDAEEEKEGDEEGSEETQKAPGWVKTVRKNNRKLESENKKLKKQLQERSTESKPPVKLGEKPTLKSVEYDDKKYETELTAWYDRKRQIDTQQAESKKTQEAQNQKWQGRQNQYLTKKDEHGFKDFEESEDMVTGTLNTIQQSIIIHGAEDSALVVYALGKNPKKLEELSRITDPVEFAIRIGKLESSLNVKTRKAPNPEKRVIGAKGGGLSGSVEKTLEKLREEAAKTGDYSKVTHYKRQQRSK